ncbi:MAG TPA: hypothetical protein VE219_03320 [Candidatus Sulfotelmatobacter sp.]|nr:hypothetical protein [Candidatus Sulfotelmatobacter sp.]
MTAAMVQRECGEVVANEHLGDGVFELVARLPHLAATTAAGQFAQLRCGDGCIPFLRRPFSVAWTQGDLCSFVLYPVGVGTRRLFELRPGDPLDVLGPLGHGFTLPVNASRALCVAGGVGCAPFPLLIRALLNSGLNDITVLSGAMTADRLYPPERYRRNSVSDSGAEDAKLMVIEATDDGTRGHHGMITELVETEMSRGGNIALYACGPNVMLAALARVLDVNGLHPALLEASFEAPMGCGFGTCLGCALPVRRDGRTSWMLCCTEGPVMPLNAIDWEVLRERALTPVA